MDLRSALSIDPKNQTTQDAMRTLLTKTAEEASTKSPSVSALLVQSCSSTAHETESPATHNLANPDYRSRFEAAQRLAVLSKDSKIALQISRERGYQLLFTSFVSLRKKEGELPAPSLQVALLRILAHVCAAVTEFSGKTSPENNTKEMIAVGILESINNTNLNLILGQMDFASSAVAADMLSSLVLYCLPLMASNKNLQKSAVLIVGSFIRMLDSPLTPQDLGVACMNGLVKSIGDASSAITFFSSPSYYITVLSLVTSPHTKLGPLVPVALARFLEYLDETSSEKAKEALFVCISNWLEGSTQGDKTRGLLALSAVFMARVEIGTSMLVKDGVLESMMDIVEFESDEIQLATLNVLSNACSNQQCRTIISQRCIPYLKSLLTNKSAKLKTLAAAILIKIMFTDKEVESQLVRSTDSFTDHFSTIIQDDISDFNLKLNALESLVYLTTKPFHKEKVANSPRLLTALFSMIKKTEDRSAHYAIASIISNLVGYRRRLTDEEQQLQSLKKVAGEMPASNDESDSRNDESVVNKRIASVIKSGGIPALILAAKSSSPSTREVVSLSFVAMSTPKQSRGILIQQAAIPALLSLTQPSDTPTALYAAHSLAKIAITNDPNVAFNGSRAQSLIKPLLALLSSQHELQQFEGLLALTNLASMPSPDPRALLVSLNSLPIIENLQFSDNIMIRRAATELICNLLFDPVVFEKYANPETAANRLKIMIALSDVEDDLPTRKAASGALAIISSHPPAAAFLMEAHPRVVEVLVGLIKGEDDWEIVHRGIEVLKNCTEEEAVAKKLASNEEVVEMLQVLTKADIKEVRDGAVHTVKNLMQWKLL
ncbi:Protein unc-45 A [Nowakowskiella sp. JEL0078]|nr:Protein unc-45 A [Nowakowskiella sp. JEL0078]